MIPQYKCNNNYMFIYDHNFSMIIVRMRPFGWLIPYDYNMEKVKKNSMIITPSFANITWY